MSQYTKLASDSPFPSPSQSQLPAPATSYRQDWQEMHKSKIIGSLTRFISRIVMVNPLADF
jgi:hypothetical protein